MSTEMKPYCVCDPNFDGVLSAGDYCPSCNGESPRIEREEPIKPHPNAAGGKALAKKTPPKNCPRCHRSMVGKNWYQWLGHLSMHKQADKYFKGDVEAYQRRLRRNSLAKQDPESVRYNGAWPEYKHISEPD